MNFKLLSCLTLLPLISFVLSSPSKKYPTSPTISLVHAFPPNTSLENLAIRRNNQVLLTLLNQPSLYLVDPIRLSDPTLIQHFSDATAVLGITEGAPDIFYVAGGAYSPATRVYKKGSWRIWAVDFQSSYGDIKPEISKIADLTTANFVNGLATLSSRYILAADSALGAVFRIDITTGESTVVIQDPTMAPSATVPFGINGLRIRGEYLYYTNSVTNALVRIPVDLTSGTARGEAEVLSTDFILPDDFAIGKKGAVYVTENAGNVFSVFDKGNKTVLLDSESSGGLIVGPTSVKLGRRKDSGEELFVTTSGGPGSTGGVGSRGKLLRIGL